MEFNTPTTKEEMYAVLQDIYYYYRIRREGYSEVELKELELEKLVFIPKTDEELQAVAETILSAENQTFEHDFLQDIKEQLKKVEDKLSSLEQNKEKLIAQTQATYEESQRKAEMNAVNNGLAGSSIIVDKWTALETEKNRRLLEIEQDFDLQNVNLTSEKDILIERMNTALAYCQDQALNKVKAKVEELKEEQAKIERNVFKYNNGIEEKVQKYKNSITEANANLLLKFMEIRNGEYSKSELVEMGYYQRAIDCVCAYYNTLNSMTAANEIGKETKLVIYLDDYYQSILYMYQQRALFEKEQNQS